MLKGEGSGRGVLDPRACNALPPPLQDGFRAFFWLGLLVPLLLTSKEQQRHKAEAGNTTQLLARSHPVLSGLLFSINNLLFLLHFLWAFRSKATQGF